MKKPLKLHFYRSSSQEKNFGDELSPLFVEWVSRRKVDLAPVHACDLISLGSIFDGVIRKLWTRKVRLDRSPIHVWGSGFIQDKNIKKNVIKKNFKIHAVRGELTHQKTDIESVVYGDPGLLSKFLISGQQKRIKVLIIPHISHRKLPEIKQIANGFRNHAIADLTRDPLEILRQIASADIVLSSSLHGLICADSFAIPNIRLKVNQQLKGGDFKFKDYYSSLGRDIQEVGINCTEKEINAMVNSSDFSYQSGIDKICEKLIKAFPSELK